VDGSDSFAVQQAKLAWAALEKFFDAGDHLVEEMQSMSFHNISEDILPRKR
jgi:hypothetical protein